MPIHYTRRQDLFVDAGFSDPQGAIDTLLKDALEIGLVSKDGEQLPFESAIALSRPWCQKHLDLPLQRLLDLAVDWMCTHTGDLSTFLWLARNLSGGEEELHLGALIFGFAARLWDHGMQQESVALVRFLVDLNFDYGALYRQSNIAYGFFKERDPNPFVWKILENIDQRAQILGARATSELNILELGCGIGNDAMGMLSNERTRSYTGLDLSDLALQHHRERAAAALGSQSEIKHELKQGNFVKALSAMAEKQEEGKFPINLVYAYSSLHYFSSAELKGIFEIIHKILEPNKGLLCFAIKGKDSIWDGNGIPLYRPDVWINNDGQSRWFPSRRAITSMLDCYGYEILMHERYEHWGYSEKGKKDLFHYVICTPRKVLS